MQTTLLVPFDSYYNPGLWNQENIKILASKVQVDLVIFYAINPMFAKLEDNEIYQDLANSLNLKKIMVADNFQDRVCQRLNTLFCKSFWKESCQIVGDFQTKPTPILLIDLLAQAQFKEFKEHSGLDFCFSALVSHGKKLGRQLGFPTINLLTPQRLPLNDGVYACQVKITGVDSLLKGAGFYWKNELDQEVFEINLLDFDQEVYDRKVDVKVIAKIREPIKFTQLEDLKKPYVKMFTRSERYLIIMKKTNFYLGSHVSMSAKEDYLVGSALTAIKNGANTLMFYTGAPQNSIRAATSKLNIEKFQQILIENELDINKVICHGPYIINLANTIKPETFELGVRLLKEELIRLEEIGVHTVVLHPGAAVGGDRTLALNSVAKGINQVYQALPNSKVKIALETMSGKGTEVCISFEELKIVLDQVEKKKWWECALTHATYMMQVMILKTISTKW
nr:deoxyribonuclease IV [Spiroplasma clarkii]